MCSFVKDFFLYNVKYQPGCSAKILFRVDLKATNSEPIGLVSRVWCAVASFLEQLVVNGAIRLLHYLQRWDMTMQDFKVISEDFNADRTVRK